MIAKFLALLFGGSGIGSGVTNAVKLAGILAAMPLAWNWFEGHQHDVVLTLNVAQALFVVGIVVALLQVAHVARGPGQGPWNRD
jgi:hypothetical protein